MHHGRPRTERIKSCDTCGLEIRHVAGHDSEAVLKRRCRNHKIGTVVAKSGAQLAPTSGDLQIKGQNPFAVESQHAVEPSCKRRGEIRVCCSLPRNTAFDLTDRNDT